MLQTPEMLSCMQVIITTYELVLKDASILNHIKWNYMMVDEAHRLKNHESALYQEMTQFSFKNRLLITGLYYLPRAGLPV